MKIADRILNFTVGSSTLKAALTDKNGYMPLAEAPVSSDGHFEIVLPDIVLGYSYLLSPKERLNDIHVYPESLKIAIVDSFWLVDSNEYVIGNVFQGSARGQSSYEAGEIIVSRWYANQYGTIIGMASCDPHGNVVDFELSLKKGWNDVVRQFNSDMEESIRSAKNVRRMQWFMIASDESATINGTGGVRKASRRGRGDMFCW